jgi:hypothetical protein
MSSFAVSPKQKQAGGKQASKLAEMMMMTIWRRSIEWLEFRSRGIEHTTTHSKPSIDHGSIKCKSWRSQSRGADKGDRERERERGPHAGSELIASTRHKNLSEKGPGLQREKRREEQKNYKHAACEKACDDVRLPHNTEHQPPRHHACMLEIIWSHKSCWCFEAI